ncbi:MAG TPA: hypothetical protein VGF91_27680 [Solirubrobacteraceae bacterium]
MAGAIKLERLRRDEGLVLGAADGCLFGVSGISLKFLTHAADHGMTSALISSLGDVGIGSLPGRLVFRLLAASRSGLRWR